VRPRLAQFAAEIVACLAADLEAVGPIQIGQLDFGGNDLAELDAGLGIIQEAFSVYENDVANGRSISNALRSMCQILSQASGLWLQEFNRVSSRMRVGFP
jgi:hypothetical protein